MSDNVYFKHYEGSDPYIFISYAHADSDEVMRIITDMHSRGFRLWYDEGIEVGSEWQECIAEHLVTADLMIAFISNAYMRSDNCRKEMSYALSKKKKIINIFLEETALSPGMELQLGNIFAIMKYTYPSEAYFYTKLYGAELFRVSDYGCADVAVEADAKQEKAAQRLRKKKAKERRKTERAGKKKRRWIAPLAVFVVIFGCAVAALIVGYFTGYLQRFMTDTVPLESVSGTTVAEFNNDVLERAAREYSGKSEGDITVSDLTGLTSLYIVGDEYFLEQPLEMPLTDGKAESVTVTAASGEERTVSRGTISDLSDLRYFQSLTTLWLCCEDISSLETMPAIRVEELSIAGNRVTSLEGIANLSKLQTLITDGCPLLDVLTLEKCLDLREVSMIGANVSDLSAFKPLTKFSSAAISNCTLSELGPLMNNSHLSSLTLYDCDVRGALFRSFDKEKNMVSLALVRCTIDSARNIEDFLNLAVLRIESCEGLADYSAVLTLPKLVTLYIDSAMEPAMEAVISAAQFEVVVTDR